ncbi:uncharacterized protein UHO2_04170 [Ustilago hordei]|uniref:Uncharacterized protein n=1 Tax=Ustilago hordei TaxID=120017 RepID=I2FWQ8_USTHO|nr:uncharacterized protein UHO2_04170 [Ustilago hordei]CCF51351.1 uncharacterized protein UHOR_14885 [Ustilago hordei]SYW79527.1 uncharacterized protein UHO2_04170 [Ustilago hordei]
MLLLLWEASSTLLLLLILPILSILLVLLLMVTAPLTSCGWMVLVLLHHCQGPSPLHLSGNLHLFITLLSLAPICLHQLHHCARSLLHLVATPLFIVTPCCISNRGFPWADSCEICSSECGPADSIDSCSMTSVPTDLDKLCHRAVDPTDLTELCWNSTFTQSMMVAQDLSI